MVGVVGSSPIAPTSDLGKQAFHRPKRRDDITSASCRSARPAEADRLNSVSRRRRHPGRLPSLRCRPRRHRRRPPAHAAHRGRRAGGHHRLQGRVLALSRQGRVAGLAHHLAGEWVLVANLFALLVGFALLPRHFEESRIPLLLPRFLPDDWKGGFVMLVVVFVLSSFLDNIAAAMIGGAMATRSTAAGCTSASSPPSSLPRTRAARAASSATPRRP